MLAWTLLTGHAGETAAQSKSSRGELGALEVTEASKQTPMKHLKGIKESSTKLRSWEVLCG